MVCLTERKNGAFLILPRGERRKREKYGKESKHLGCAERPVAEAVLRLVMPTEL